MLHQAPRAMERKAKRRAMARKARIRRIALAARRGGVAMVHLATLARTADRSPGHRATTRPITVCVMLSAGDPALTLATNAQRTSTERPLPPRSCLAISTRLISSRQESPSPTLGTPIRFLLPPRTSAVLLLPPEVAKAKEMAKAEETARKVMARKAKTRVRRKDSAGGTSLDRPATSGLNVGTVPTPQVTRDGTGRQPMTVLSVPVRTGHSQTVSAWPPRWERPKKQLLPFFTPEQDSRLYHRSF